MDLKIINIYPDPQHDDEYVKIKVVEKCNLGNYAITDETFDKEGKETDVFRHTYFFPDIIIEKDNIIYLYTGRPNKNNHKSNKTTTVLHWGSGKPVWNNSKDRATIISYEKGDSSSYGTFLRLTQVKNELDKIVKRNKKNV